MKSTALNNNAKSLLTTALLVTALPIFALAAESAELAALKRQYAVELGKIRQTAAASTQRLNRQYQTALDKLMDSLALK